MDAQSIVARLRAAKGREREEVLGGLYAEKVDLRHVPPSEHDGVMSREQLVAGAPAERGLFENAIPDFNSTHSYEVEGERIVEQFHMRGTLRDGQVLDNRMTITYTVSDGAISAMTAEIDPEGSAPLRTVIVQAGGFPRPDAES